ncbi:MAG: SDR family oxidoreductase [Ectothiorhodospiraceae bacterium]|nr:SDR family oxidoreductase [Ectothiorhodospiraceae bacterium]
MSHELDGKVALVTGGSRGIGRAIALALAERGADVVICGRTESDLDRTAAEIRDQGRRAVALRADVSRIEDIEHMVRLAAEATGRIDILVNNAVTSTSAPFDELTDDLFRYHIDVKLMAYIRIARLVLPLMRAAGGGRIVNIGGMTARIVAPLRTTNGVVNAGVANFTKHFAHHAAKHAVTVNCVHPGYTVTERVQQIFEREAKELGTDVDAVVTRRTAEIPLGRLIRPEDIAGAVLFFCSPLASMVTGQCIAVDGGSGQAIAY